MPGSARAWRWVRHLLLVLCLVVAPALEAPDGDVADVEVGAAETVVTPTEPPVHRPDVAPEAGSPVSARPLLSPPTGLPVPWRPHHTFPIRCRCSLCACARASDAVADPA